jgi:hypothetical protein
LISEVPGPLVVELTVGLPPEIPLTSGGRDLDNYLYPVAHRLGPHRLSAVFARKIHGSSRLTAGPAQPEPPTTAALFTTRMSAHTSAPSGRRRCVSDCCRRPSARPHPAQSRWTSSSRPGQPERGRTSGNPCSTPSDPYSAKIPPGHSTRTTTVLPFSAYTTTPRLISAMTW